MALPSTTAGAVAADVGIALIPGGKAAAEGVKSARKQVAKNAARGAAALVPAGDQQLQFEITAIFGLAIADIHDKKLDKEQAHALVLGLSKGRGSQQRIATMATDVARVSTGGAGQPSAAGGGAPSPWADTLADMLPGEAARSLVEAMRTGRVDTTPASLSGKQQAAVEYGVRALAVGATRFRFGREVVEAARVAFAEAPDPPRALTAAKGVGEAISGAAASLFKTKKRGRHAAGLEHPAIEE